MNGPHHPTLHSTNRDGCWATCTCGWSSDVNYRTTTGAHLAFGRHLVTERAAAITAKGAAFVHIDEYREPDR